MVGAGGGGGGGGVELVVGAGGGGGGGVELVVGITTLEVVDGVGVTYLVCLTVTVTSGLEVLEWPSSVTVTQTTSVTISQMTAFFSRFLRRGEATAKEASEAKAMREKRMV